MLGRARVVAVLVVATAMLAVTVPTTAADDPEDAPSSTSDLVVFTDTFFCKDCEGVEDLSRFTPGQNGYRMAEGVEIQGMSFAGNPWGIVEDPGDPDPYAHPHPPYSAKSDTAPGQPSSWILDLELPHQIAATPGDPVLKPAYTLQFYWKSFNFERNGAEASFVVYQVTKADGEAVYPVGGDTCWTQDGDFNDGYFNYGHVFVTTDNPNCRFLLPGAVSLQWTVDKGDYDGGPHPPYLLLDHVRIEPIGVEDLRRTQVFAGELCDFALGEACIGGGS